MIICDLCKGECYHEKKVRIHYDYACKAYQEKEIHMCENCRIELDQAMHQAQVEFYQRKVAKANEVPEANARRIISAEDVRKMTPIEVRQNYQDIVSSMKEWK